MGFAPGAAVLAGGGFDFGAGAGTLTAGGAGFATDGGFDSGFFAGTVTAGGVVAGTAIGFVTGGGVLTTGGGATTGGFATGGPGVFDPRSSILDPRSGGVTTGGTFVAAVPVSTGAGGDGTSSRHGGARSQVMKTSPPRTMPRIFSAARATRGLSDL